MAKPGLRRYPHNAMLGRAVRDEDAFRQTSRTRGVENKGGGFRIGPRYFRQFCRAAGQAEKSSAFPIAPSTLRNREAAGNAAAIVSTSASSLRMIAPSISPCTISLASSAGCSRAFISAGTAASRCNARSATQCSKTFGRMVATRLPALMPRAANPAATTSTSANSCRYVSLRSVRSSTNAR